MHLVTFNDGGALEYGAASLHCQDVVLHWPHVCVCTLVMSHPVSVKQHATDQETMEKRLVYYGELADS